MEMCKCAVKAKCRLQIADWHVARAVQGAVVVVVVVEHWHLLRGDLHEAGAHVHHLGVLHAGNFKM